MEKEVEKIKIELASKPDFTCMGAFRAFDVRNRGGQDLHDFTDTCYEFAGHSMVDRSQVRLLFLRYAAPRIAYPEFCRIIVPSDS